MVARLAALCAIELIVALWLALQVFAAPVTISPPPAPQPPAIVASSQTTGAAPHDLPASESKAQAVPPTAKIERQGVAVNWNPDDPVGILLTGTVHWAGGGAVPGASIWAQHEKSKVSGDCGADGGYAMVGLAPGEWQFRLNIEGGVDIEETIVIGEEAVQRHDFAVERAFPIKVMIVTANGENGTMAVRTATRFAFANLVVAGQREPFPDRFAPTDYGMVFVGDAKWQPEQNPKDGFAGMLLLANAPPAHVALLQRHLVLAQQMVQPGQTEVTFAIDVDAIKALAGTATVRVLDADTGLPVEGARFSLHTSNQGVGGSTTDADGRATADCLPPGLLRCEITAKDRETMYTTVAIEPSQHLDLGDVRLGPAVKFMGKVVDAAGKPVGGVQISWAELKWLGLIRPFATNRGSRSGADGTFQLWGTGRGQVAVTAYADQERVAYGVFDNPTAEPAVLKLVEAATCTVRCPADPLRSFLVLLFDAQHRPLTAFYPDRRSIRPLKMPPGDYAYEVRDERQQLVQTGTLQFGAGPLTLEIR